MRQNCGATHTQELPARLTTIYVAALCMRSGVFRCCVCTLQGVTIRCKRGRIIPITRRAQSSQPPAVWDIYFIFFPFFKLLKKSKTHHSRIVGCREFILRAPREKKSTFIIIIILLFPPFISWVWFDSLFSLFIQEKDVEMLLKESRARKYNPKQHLYKYIHTTTPSL